MQPQRSHPGCNTMRRTSSSSNANANRVTRTCDKCRSPQPSSEFHDNLVGFSLVPSWLLFVDDHLNSPSEYPFPPTYDVSCTLSASSSTVTSLLNSRVQSPALGSSRPGLWSPSEMEDRMYWEEEYIQLSDSEEQMEDLEAVYRSITY